MDQRRLIHRYLDGELTPAESAELQGRAAADATLAQELERATALREDLQQLPVGPPPEGLTERIMSALPAAPPRRPWWLLLLRPVPVPAWVLLGLAGVVGAGGVLLRGAPSRALRTPPTTPRATAARPVAARASATVQACPAPPTIMVRFLLKAARAQQVFLAGDFNDWSTEATPLADLDGDGIWSVSLPLAPGRYQYKFLVDGRRWVIEPDATAVHSDGFGGKNSLLIL